MINDLRQISMISISSIAMLLSSLQPENVGYTVWHLDCYTGWSRLEACPWATLRSAKAVYLTTCADRGGLELGFKHDHCGNMLAVQL